MTTLLMCPSTYFRIAYEINLWMNLQRDADHALAQRQWQLLYDALTSEAGVRVRLVDPAPEQPDMVFTANAWARRSCCPPAARASKLPWPRKATGPSRSICPSS